MITRFGFKDVTADWGPVRTRVVHQKDLAATVEECRIEGYKLNKISAPNERGEIAAVFDRS
jgi:hypothetical protein